MHNNFKQCHSFNNPRSIIRHHNIINKTWIHRGTEEDSEVEEEEEWAEAEGLLSSIIVNNKDTMPEIVLNQQQHVCTCRATDHVTEECPKLMTKIQEKRNLNNQNVQWIVAEIRDPGRNINIVTRGGVKTGADAHDQKKESQCWIQKNTQPQQQFDAKKEKETFKEAKKEFLKENEASTSNTVQGMILLFFICLSLWIILTKERKQRK
jgi:hypothetical protein